MRPHALVPCALVATSTLVGRSVAGALVFAPPYSLAIPTLRNELEQCALASGFSFEAASRPNVPQLSRMCDDSGCMAVLSQLLVALDTPTANPRNYASITQAFGEFGLDMLNYCWFFRAPGDACPQEPHQALASHLADWDSACEDAIEGEFSFRVGENSSAIGFAISGRTKLCTVPECTRILTRVHYMNLVDPCIDLTADGYTQYTKLVGMYDVYCQQPAFRKFYNLSGYYFQEGPTMPLHLPDPTTLVPATSPPPLEATHDSDSKSGSGSIDGAGVLDEPTASPTDTPTVIVPTPTVSEKTQKPPSQPTTRSPSSTVIPKPAPQTTTTEVPSEMSTATTTPTSITVSRSAESVTSSRPNSTAQSSTVDAPTPSPPLPSNSALPSTPATGVIQESFSTSSSKSTVIAILTGIGAFVFLVAFILWRKRASFPSKSYTAMQSPSTSDADSSSRSHKTDADPTSIELAALLGNHNKTPPNILRDIRLIGTGGHALVYLVRDIQSDRFLASKRLVKNQLTTDKIDAFVAEIQLVATLQHPCIVEFVGASWTNRTDIQALFEFMDGGDLRTHLEATKAQSGVWSADKLQIALDVAEALVYVHSRVVPSVVHRDIKSRNVLLTSLSRLEQEPSRRRAKLTDFGVAREQSSRESMTTGVGTSRWLAPEVIIGGGAYGSACDIYSLGVVLTELDTHRVPFSDLRGEGGATSLPEITILTIVAMEGAQPSLSESCPEAIASLARACLSYEPHLRPSAEHVVTALRQAM